MGILIRSYNEADISAILGIINHNILTSTSIYDYDPRSLLEQTKILEDKKAKNFPTIVAEIEGQVVGFGTFGDFRYKQGYKFTVEHSVYISEEFKGKNIGSLLLQELIRIAKEDGYHTMIGVIDAENKGSIAFHEKHGFTTVGTLKETGYKFERWLDSVIMQLFLE